MLEFNIRNQEISRIDSFSPAEKSVGYLVAKFNFKTDDWNGASKRAIFKNVKSKVEKDAMLENDSCTVPWEVLEGSSEIEISVYGIIGTKEITTNVAVFNLNRTLQGGSATQEPSPTVYEQMLKEMQETKEIAQSVRDDADNGKFDGVQGPKGDAGSIEFKIVNELPTENISESTMYLVPLSPGTEQNEFAEYIYANGHWEYIGSSSVEVDLSEYVKKDDIASSVKPGLARIFGIAEKNVPGVGLSGNNILGIAKAEDNDIAAQEHTSKPIVPSKLSYAIKVGLTDNKLEWTDEESAKALELLGGVQKKYVDDLVGSVESILTELHAYAQTKIGGEA